MLILVPTFFSLFGKVIALVGLEARKAGKSITKLIVLAVMCGIVITSTWLCVLGLLAAYLISIQYTYTCIFTILIIVNLLILIILAKLMKQSSKYLFFPQTRMHIKNSFNLHDE
jgi:hypothetical protein